eukprot:1157911-Pelagomonas_calceolata.AAC.6
MRHERTFLPDSCACFGQSMPGNEMPSYFMCRSEKAPYTNKGKEKRMGKGRAKWLTCLQALRAA